MEEIEIDLVDAEMLQAALARGDGTGARGGGSFALTQGMPGEERATASHRGCSPLAPQAFFAAAAGAGAFRLCSSRREWSWKASTNSNTPKIKA